MAGPTFRISSLLAVVGLSCSRVGLAAPGDHVRFGNAELVPSVGFLGTWRSNNYLSPGVVAAGNSSELREQYRVRPGFNLSISPSLGLTVDGNRVKYSLRAGWEGRKYFSEELANLDRWRNTNIRSQLVALPKSVVGVKLGNSLVISGREADAVNSEDAYITQLQNDNRASLTIRPGSSMELDVGGLFNVRDYKVPPGFIGGNSANLNNRLGYGAFGDFRWRFLPKTAVVAKFEYEKFDWDKQVVATSADGRTDSGPVIDIYDGDTISFEGGLRGRFTDRLVLGAVIGYTAIRYDSPVQDTGGCEDPASDGSSADLNGFPCALTGNAEIGFDITERQRLRVGFLREHMDVFFSNYLSMNRYYIAYSGDYGKYVSLKLVGDYSLQGYHGDVAREDHWYRLRGDVVAHANAWLDFSFGTWYTGRRVTDPRWATSEYDDVNVHVGAQFTY